VERRGLSEHWSAAAPAKPPIFHVTDYPTRGEFPARRRRLSYLRDRRHAAKSATRLQSGGALRAIRVIAEFFSTPLIGDRAG